MKDEGVIKFYCDWQETALPKGDYTELLQTRNDLFAKKLIGYDTVEKVGYGNISCRRQDTTLFAISGTQTGHIRQLTADHLSFVTDAYIATNTVHCIGPSKASSESLTHAAIYQMIPSAKAVIHVHHKKLWLSLLNKLPTTDVLIGYGTTNMAMEINRLLAEADLLEHRILAMAGHEDGVIVFGATMQEALGTLMLHYSKV